jgi:hypothetical protein
MESRSTTAHSNSIFGSHIVGDNLFKSGYPRPLNELTGNKDLANSLKVIAIKGGHGQSNHES